MPECRWCPCCPAASERRCGAPPPPDPFGLRYNFFNKTGATPPSPVRPSGAPSLTKAVSPAGGDPFQYRDSIAYQQVQSLYAIGSGGLFGRGEGQASVYVPVRESDMIFTVVGESFGFIGGTLVIFLYFYLFYQILYAAINTNNKANLYIAAAFVFSLLFQIFENIGAAIGILPLTGIPLPILSQGGTSLIVLGIGFGIMMGFKKN